MRSWAVDVGDITEVARIASQRPLKDAAFFVAVSIKKRRIGENAYEVLKTSHMGASDQEIEEAIAASDKLEADCLATMHEVPDGGNARFVLQKAKDANPGFMPETYSLLQDYVRKSENEVAPGFRSEKSLVTSRGWSDIPYFREISAIVFALLEIAETVVSVGSWNALDFSQFNLIGYLGFAAWLAFLVFAFVSFRKFSFRWLRMVAAFLVLVILPFVVGAIYLVAYSFKIIPPIPIEWILLAAPAGAVVGLL
jgi:hypothetical protein